MIDYCWMKQVDDEWYQMLTVNLYNDKVEVVEWMQTIDNEDYFGRTLTIEDPTAFMRSYHVKSERDFEKLMEAKNEKGILTLDNIHRHCERHQLKYKIEGKTLGAARLEYLKELDEEDLRQRDKARELYDQGVNFLLGKNGEKKDLQKAIWLLEHAAIGGCKKAEGRLAKYYYYKHKRHEAIVYAQRGSDVGDPMSMYILSLLYRDGADFENLSDYLTGKPDMALAAKWCLKSAKKGWYQAMRDLNRYIHNGHLVPDTKLYLELLVLQAKFNNIRIAGIIKIK